MYRALGEGSTDERGGWSFCCPSDRVCDRPGSGTERARRRIVQVMTADRGSTSQNPSPNRQPPSCPASGAVSRPGSIDPRPRETVKVVAPSVGRSGKRVLTDRKSVV